MNVHKNAKLTPAGRVRLVDRLLSGESRRSVAQQTLLGLLREAQAEPAAGLIAGWRRARRLRALQRAIDWQEVRAGGQDAVHDWHRAIPTGFKAIWCLTVVPIVLFEPFMIGRLPLLLISAASCIGLSKLFSVAAVQGQDRNLQRCLQLAATRSPGVPELARVEAAT